jgi:hypothetical protein
VECDHLASIIKGDQQGGNVAETNQYFGPVSQKAKVKQRQELQGTKPSSSTEYGFYGFIIKECHERFGTLLI